MASTPPAILRLKGKEFIAAYFTTPLFVAYMVSVVTCILHVCSKLFSRLRGVLVSLAYQRRVRRSAIKLVSVQTTNLSAFAQDACDFQLPPARL